MLQRLGVVLLSLIVALPAAAGGAHHARVEGAGAPKALTVSGRAGPAWVLHPGGAATLLLEGPAKVTVAVRAAGPHLARVRALVSHHHRHARLDAPARPDRAAHAPGFDAVGEAATTTVRLGRGRQWITVAWPHHTRVDGLLTFQGVDLGVHLKPAPVAAAATPKIPLAALTPRHPAPAAKAKPVAATTPTTRAAAPATARPPAKTAAVAQPAPPAPAPKATAAVASARPAPPPPGYERIRAYGDRTEAPAPAGAGTEAEAHGGAGRTVSVTPWVGAYIPLYKLSVGPAAGLSFALDLRSMGLTLGSTRLALRLDVGWTRVIESGPAIVPGRGLDVGFTQDSHLVPASLALAWHLAPTAAVRPFILAGVGTLWTQTHFTAFSAPVTDRAFGVLGVFGAGLGFAAGPGDLGIEALVDVAGVDLGPLGPVGETTLSGVRVDARYAVAF